MRTFELYCNNIENVENYEKAKADNFEGWDCHHRLETHTSDGERRLVDIIKKELIDLGIYYHRPSEELIFLTTKEHRSLHRKGKQLSEETCKKISDARKGKKYGPLSEETKKKMSEAHKGKPHSEESRRNMSEAHKGKHYSEETRKKMSESRKGKQLSEEQKKKISNVVKGLRWFNNSERNIRAKECPEGFVPGRLKKR